MKILLVPRNVVLAEDAELADSIFPRMKGLLGRKELKGGQALILKPCNSIHMFFMRFPIDVLFLDRQNSITALLENIKPFQISRIYPKAVTAIELPSGTIKSNSISLGESVLLV